MANGTLKITTAMAQDAEPVSGVSWAVMDKSGKVLYNGITNANGESDVVSLEAPDKALTLSPNTSARPYGVYDVWVGKPNFTSTIYKDVEIFDGVQGILPVNMTPFSGGAGEIEERTIVIPPPTAYMGGVNNTNQPSPPDEPITSPAHDQRLNALSGNYETINPLSLPAVTIPDYITVHLGTPGNTSAPNVRVRFIDYIKNVLSREIYSTWPASAITANAHAVVTFTLNRIYTEWYRSRGFDYDITNSTQTDQAFTYGGEIFQPISQIVDGVFNVYARRIGFRNPYFTQYCDGKITTCKGLSQWGTVTLANRGMTPLQILRNYYGNDIELSTATGGGVLESFAGTLTIGSTGAAVLRLQNQLNRIRGNFPLIPAVNPTGTFDADTAAAVRAFQRQFNLTQDGIVGRTTWNAVQQKFGAVTGLSELGGEGERVGLSPNPPTSTIRQGAFGADVVQAQFLLNYISQFYPEIPTVIQDARFGITTTAAVQAFQRRFGLNADGVIGANTWRRLYEVASGIIGQQPPSAPTPPIEPPVTPPTLPPTNPFPNVLLRQGSTGENVRTLQTMLNKARVRYNAIPLLAVDGNFGPMTNTAVRTFQLYHGLTVDGIVGPITWNALNSVI